MRYTQAMVVGEGRGVRSAGQWGAVWHMRMPADLGRWGVDAPAQEASLATWLGDVDVVETWLLLTTDQKVGGSSPSERAASGSLSTVWSNQSERLALVAFGVRGGVSGSG